MWRPRPSAVYAVIQFHVSPHPIWSTHSKATRRSPMMTDATNPTALYYLKLHLTGVAEALVYTVAPEVQARFRSFCGRVAEGTHDTEFFAFDTLDGFEVLLATRAIQAVHLLWDHSRVPEGEELQWARNRARKSVRMFLNGNPIPIEMGVSDPVQIAAAYSQLDLEGSEFEAFQFWTDEDGEDFFVSVVQLALLEVPTHLNENGRRSLEAESSRIDGKATGKTPRATKTAARPRRARTARQRGDDNVPF